MEQDIQWLKATKYLWLYSRENMPERRCQEFKTLQKLDLKVSRGWAIKENLRNLWNYSRMEWALKFFNDGTSGLPTPDYIQSLKLPRR